MHRSYCTLFDKNYLFQGVALHDSLVASARDFTLYALAMDEEAFVMLAKLGRDTLVPVRVDELLTDEVRQVRARTSHGQFCWVNQPLICEYLLDRYSLDMVTYLESDSLFFSNPEPLFEELASSSVSLVPHHYSPGFDQKDKSGVFCVQFNAFRNDARARAVLAHWKTENFRYDKTRPMYFPGQMCMDSWPEKFEGVKIITHKGAGVAPWNVRGYEVTVRDGTPHVDGVPVVFYHYHQYGRLRSGAHDLSGYPITKEVINAFYRPYVAALARAEQAVKDVDPSFDFRRVYADSVTLGKFMRAPSKENLASYLFRLKRKVLRRFNVYPDQFFT
jgi:hypothetical protein